MSSERLMYVQFMSCYPAGSVICLEKALEKILLNRNLKPGLEKKKKKNKKKLTDGLLNIKLYHRTKSSF